MKVFIVFLGLCIINVSFLTYQGDMGRYARCQTYLKAVAEECAAGASLYYEKEEYSGGRFQFDYEEGGKYIEYILEQTDAGSPLPEGTGLSYQVDFRDDVRGYVKGSITGYPDIETEDAEGIPSVTVEITAATPDLFHLSFLEVKEIKRAARYELPQ
jgi:hypothetical protein